MKIVQKIFISGILALSLSPLSVNAQSAYQAPQLGTQTGLYRLYNPVTGNHLYTVDYNEAFGLNSSGLYQLEGTVGNIYTVQAAGTTPLYRLYNRRTNKHAFIIGTNGLVALKNLGYKQEAIIGYIINDSRAFQGVSSSNFLYDVQNDKTKDWLLTKDANEMDAAKIQGYVSKVGPFFIF